MIIGSERVTSFGLRPICIPVDVLSMGIVPKVPISFDFVRVVYI